MEKTVLQVLLARKAISELGNKNYKYDLNHKLAIFLADTKIIEEAYKKALDKIKEDYFEKDEHGELKIVENRYVFLKNKFGKEYNKEVEELNNSSVSENEIHNFKINSTEEKELSPTVNQLESLSIFEEEK